jgi:hypothetical protein
MPSSEGIIKTTFIQIQTLITTADYYNTETRNV